MAAFGFGLPASLAAQRLSLIPVTSVATTPFPGGFPFGVRGLGASIFANRALAVPVSALAINPFLRGFMGFGFFPRVFF